MDVRPPSGGPDIEFFPLFLHSFLILLTLTSEAGLLSPRFLEFEFGSSAAAESTENRLDKRDGSAIPDADFAPPLSIKGGVGCTAGVASQYGPDCLLGGASSDSCPEDGYLPNGSGDNGIGESLVDMVGGIRAE